MLLAVIVCALFFIPYSYYIAPPPSAHLSTNATHPTSQNTTAQTPEQVLGQQTPTPVMPSVNKAAVEDSALFTVKSKDYEMIFDKQGRVAQLTLLGHRYGEDGRLSLLNSSGLRPLEMRYANKDFLQAASQNDFRIIAGEQHINIDDSPQEITIEQNLHAYNTVRKRLVFFPDGHFEIYINGFANGKPSPLGQFFISPGERPIADSDAFVFNGAMVKKADGTIETFDDGDVSSESKIDSAVFLSAVDRYYATVLYAHDSFPAAVVVGNNNNPALFASFDDEAAVFGYIGAKDLKHLREIEPMLGDVVEYGMITFFAKPLFSLLEWLYGISGNWGWAIVLLTIIVRVVLFPLTYKGMVSMQKFKDIAPKMKEIQQKYKGDAQKMQTQMMELYRKHGANPLGGCLPLLLQMPIFFAIYRVLYNAIELKGAEWVAWITDLSVMDPYFVLPILMGASMFIQQLITPTSFTDPMQEKVFKYLPLIFTIFFITFPAGLVLYWFVSNIFSIIQQYAINKIMESRKKQIVENKPDDKGE